MAIGIGGHADDATFAARRKLVRLQTKALIDGTAIGGGEHVCAGAKRVHAPEVIGVSKVKISATFSDVDAEMLGEGIRE